ncbi:purine-cytosine permease [Clavulina sp. PMI_390]|nr:purine-cytosine permease [Clavulina sp. PMI_390]
MSSPYDSEEKGSGISSPDETHVDVPLRDREEAIAERFGPFQSFFVKLANMGVEARGIERVPEDERSDRNSLNSLFLWFSVNTVLTTVPIGSLAQAYFTLTLPHTIGVTMGFAALGCLLPAFIATLGPKTGLRTMVIARYSSGYVGGSIFSFLNILTQMGFSVTCVILGGLTLSSINDALPLTWGIIIVSICTLIICFFGYGVLHIYERYVWTVLLVVMLMLYGLGGKAGYDVNAQKAFEDTGRNYAGDVLSYGGIVFGSCAGWAPVAADYNVRLPANTSSVKVFFLVFFGIWIPVTLIEILGAALMTTPGAADLYESGSIGAILASILEPWHGFGKFILVILSLSVIANNVPNTYSAALSFQALTPWFQRIPRAVWTLVVAIAYTIAGVVGREHFSSVLSNLLSILSYWTAFFVVIVAEEHFLFRRGKMGYDLEAYEDSKKLPLGIAAIVSGLLGVMGAVLGMAETYYIGVIGIKVAQPYGGDLGFELAAAFTAVSFPILRWFEIKWTGR